MSPSKQIQYIKDHAFDTPLKRIAKIIGRSPCFVQAEMKRQGIVVPQEIRDGFRRDSLIKKGTPAWNKGVAQSKWMDPATIEKIKKTRFKKGHLPHNTKADFDLSLRTDVKGYQYYYIRVKQAKWVLYHRWLWEQVHGTIPKGCNIQFKDHNSLNCTIENLYMIRKKDQHIINMKGGARIPYELQETVLLINKLKMQIHEKQNH